jgi:hypothetical protein
MRRAATVVVVAAGVLCAAGMVDGAWSCCQIVAEAGNTGDPAPTSATTGLVASAVDVGTGQPGKVRTKKPTRRPTTKPTRKPTTTVKPRGN